MEKEEFERARRKAETFAALGSRPHYWEGYQFGLRARFYSEKFGTEKDNLTWPFLMVGIDETRKEWGRGYRDGLAGVERGKTAEADVQRLAERLLHVYERNPQSELWFEIQRLLTAIYAGK
jgi:hypothetical protein